MKTTCNWLKDFIDVKLSAKDLAQKLTMAGLEVVSLEEKDGDFIFEIEITSNRPDWLSVVGIAREIAAITKSKVKSQKSKVQVKSKNLEKNALEIKIHDKKDCSLYTAKIIRDVKVTPSPEWLRKRLELIGCRSINNVVDITNYIMFTYGQPLHAFDLDKLSPNEIFVRRAKANEKIVTIDEQEKTLNPDILVIADSQRPIAIAGIMGGKNTEVTSSTKNILLEAAVFNPVIVRRGRQALGLQSESAYRFERGVDAENLEKISFCALDLIQNCGGGEFILAKNQGTAKIKSVQIILDVSSVEKILGSAIPAKEICKILGSLGFGVRAKTKNKLMVKAPAHRRDIQSSIDLIEEIARIYGYENIATTLAKVKIQAIKQDVTDDAASIKNILAGLGLNEVITHSLIDRNLLDNAAGQLSLREPIEILNPLSKEQEILRPIISLSLARCVAYNLNRQQECVRLFEIAKRFSEAGKLPEEKLTLSIALSGTATQLLSGGVAKEKLGALHLKGIVEKLFSQLGINNYSFNAETNGNIDIFIGQEKAGFFYRLTKNALDFLNIKNKDVVLAEIYLDTIITCANLGKKFLPLPKYPHINRDISLVLKDDISLKEVLSAIKEKGHPLLISAAIVDYYQGKQIPDGYRGLTVSCVYRSNERTLTEEEINPLNTLIQGMLKETFGAKIR